MENEDLQIYKIGVIIKFDRSYDRFQIYNKIRAIQDVVIVTPRDVNGLDRRNTDKVEYGYVTIKFISSTHPNDTIKNIEMAATRGHDKAKKIDGLLGMYYNISKIAKL